MLLWPLTYRRSLFSLRWGVRRADWTYSRWVAQTNLQLGILLPWSPKGWDPGCRPMYLASLYMFLCEQTLLILLHECPGMESGSNGSSQFKVLKNCQAILTRSFAILHRKMCGGFECWPLAHFPYGHRCWSWYSWHYCEFKVLTHGIFSLHFSNDGWCERFFIHPLTICISSLDNYLFKCLNKFSVRFFSCLIVQLQWFLKLCLKFRYAI